MIPVRTLARRIGPMRVVTTALVTFVIVAVAVLAGQWQFGRYETRAQAQQAYEAAAAAPPVGINQLAEPGTNEWGPGVVWRTVTAEGRYDPDSLTLLRNRPVEGTIAEHLLAWFITDEGDALAVSAGWVDATAPEGSTIPALPTGSVRIRVVLRDWEEDDGRRDSGATRITPEQIGPAPAAIYPGYGMVRHDCDPGPGCAVPADTREVPVPRLGTGPHLSYAWQWWVFAALAPIGAVLLLRRDALAATPTAEASPRRSRRRRELTDEEVEDSLPATPPRA